MESKIKKYPFKHLAAYEREDYIFYFGREEKTNELYQMTFETDLILIYGASGVGKSSLIRCGLANKFKSYEWLDISVRRGNKINDSLAEALNKQIEKELEKKDIRTYPQASDIKEQINVLHSLCYKPIYLIFDQFEELYISGSEEEQREFYKNVKKILSLNQPVKIIISIREEYLGYLYEFEKEIPQLFSHKCWVQPLKLEVEDENGNIIDEILQGLIDNKNESCVSIQDGDKENLSKGIKDMFRNAGMKTVDLPCLQILFDELYLSLTNDNNFKKSVIFSFEEFKSLFTENIQDILWHYLEKIVDAFLIKEKRIEPNVIWEVLRKLVTDKGTKRNLSEHFLAAELQLSKRDVDSITHFFKDNILSRRENGDDTYWELRHDALAKCILEKLDNEVRLKNLIEAKMSSDSKDDDLTPFQLNEINRCKERLFLTNDEKVWVEKCRKRIRRKRFLQIIGMTGLLVLLLFALWQWREADKAYSKAEKLIDAFYFYDDKFALAYKNNSFYFIDKNGDFVSKLCRWQKAEQFDAQTGFAKVSHDKDWRKIYLLDTLGNYYRYANNIKDLDNDLQILDLSHGGLQQFPLEICNLTKLIKLNLYNNGLDNLPSGIRNLTNLTELNLLNNHLTKLPPEIWELPNLKKIDLGHNQIDTLSSEIKKLSNLTDLLIYGNRLRKLPPEIGELSNLKTLILFQNKLDTLPPEIGNLTNLIKLDLSNNQFKKIPSSIEKLSNLKELYLQCNHELEELPSGIGKLSNLEKLELWYTKLERLPSEFWELSNLTDLKLDCKGLEELPPTIKNLSNLTDLKLFGSKLKKLPSEFWELSNLKSLSLSGNRFEELPSEIGKLSNLTYLGLGGNQLKKIPSSIGKLSNLTYIELSNNQLKEIPSSIGKLSNLRRLDLNNNQLEKLPSSIGNLTKLELLTLNDNPLKSLPVGIKKLQLSGWARSYLYNNSLDSISISYIKEMENEIREINIGIVKKQKTIYNKEKVLISVCIYDREQIEANNDTFKKYNKHFAIWRNGFMTQNNIYEFCIETKYKFTVYALIFVGIIGGIVFHIKKRRLYKWLCFGGASAIILFWMVLYGYLLLA